MKNFLTRFAIYQLFKSPWATITFCQMQIRYARWNKASCVNTGSKSLHTHYVETDTADIPYHSVINQSPLSLVTPSTVCPELRRVHLKNRPLHMAGFFFFNSTVVAQCHPLMRTFHDLWSNFCKTIPVGTQITPDTCSLLLGSVYNCLPGGYS